MVEFPLAGLKISITQPLAWACDEPANSAPLLLSMADCVPAVSKLPHPEKQDTGHFGSSTGTDAKHSKDA